MAPQDAIGQPVYDDITARLRETYPYMKIDRVKSIALHCKEVLEDDIEAQARMEATKARISFLTHSPELRNRIYELLLMPQENGNGGIPGCKDIFIGIHDPCGESCPRCMEGDTCRKCNYAMAKSSPYRKPHAITRASRQVRQEALSLYYGANTFVGWPDEEYANRGGQDSFCDAQRWLRMVGKANAVLIKDLQIRIVLFYLYSESHSSESRKEVLDVFKPEKYGLAAKAVRYLECCTEGKSVRVVGKLK